MVEKYNSVPTLAVKGTDGYRYGECLLAKCRQTLLQRSDEDDALFSIFQAAGYRAVSVSARRHKTNGATSGRHGQLGVGLAVE